MRHELSQPRRTLGERQPAWHRAETVVVFSQQALFGETGAAPRDRLASLDPLANGTVLVSRTMMLAELTVLLSELPSDATVADYDRAIKVDNVLRKTSAMNRAKTSKLLRNLFGLDATKPIFRALRRLWLADPSSGPMLALLQTYAREPYLRATWPVLCGLPVGGRVATQELHPLIQAAAAGRLSPISLRTAAHHVSSTWKDGGLLSGVGLRVRTRPTASPAAVAFALFLGYLQGRRGLLLLQTVWTELVQADADELLRLATAASQQGLMQLLRAGDVMEVRFPGWLTEQEEALLAEQN